MQQQWIVTDEDAGEKLISFLKKSLQQKCSQEFSLKRLKSFIDAGYCRLNDRKERFSHTRLCKQDCVQFILPEIVPEKMKNKLPAILFEDEHMVIYNKTVGTVCDEKLEKVLKAFLVHRLDKETTGVLVLAKSKEVRDHFFEQFRKRQIEKEYVALVDGVMKNDHGTIKNYLIPIQKFQGTTIYGVTDNEKKMGALFAHTDWQCIEKGEQVTFLRLFPHTGRTHQLRVHLCHLGHPIMADVLYGKETVIASRQLLHAEKLSFFHFGTKKMMQVIAPLPDDFKQAIQKTVKVSK